MKRLYLLAFPLLLWACSKPDLTATGDPNNPALNRPYCPVPEAVNYNWNFPGKPDSSICYYPTDVFKGTYLLVDTFAREDFSVSGSDTFLIQLIPLTRTRMQLKGLCSGPSDSLLLTATRFLHADIDSTTPLGRLLCRPQDTIAGFLTRNLIDSTRLKVSFTVRSDTGMVQHYGTAVRQ